MPQDEEINTSGADLDLDESSDSGLTAQTGEMPEVDASSQPVRDLSVIVAEALFCEALQLGQPCKRIETGNVVIIEAPNQDWVRPVLEAGPAALLGWRERPQRRLGQQLPKSERNFCTFECSSKDRSRDSLVYEIADEMTKGRTCLIVTADLAAIPVDLQHSSDNTLVLKNPTSDWLERVLAAVTGDPHLEAGEAIRFQDLKPEMLKLALRPGQSADDFVSRLARLTGSARSQNQNAKLGLDDLHGMPEMISWAKALAADIRAYKAGLLPWSDMDRGVLLSGPPGTGKTTVARAIADHCGIAFFPTSYSTWQGSGAGHLGDVTRAIRTVFHEARKDAPSLVFIDELDSINSRDNSSKHGDWWRSINNTLLEELDGAVAREGVFVLGATNYTTNIDLALKRSGRLDREIEINLPDTNARGRIFQVYLGDALPQPDIDRLASLASGHTGADVAAWVRRARRTARAARRDINYGDVLNEIVGETNERDPEDMYRIAVHEAGHALLVTRANPSTPPALLLGRGGKLGGQTALSAAFKQILTSKDVDKLLMALLAGRAAEHVICGDVSAGAGGPAHSDLGRATRLAAMAEASYCFGSTGLLWADMNSADQIQSQLALRPGTEAAVRRRLDEAHEAATAVIVANRPVVERLAEALVERFVLTPADVGELIDGGWPTP